MMLSEAIQHHWEYYRERPFGRMVRLFVERIFRGGGDSDSEGLDLGIGLVLTMLAMPGGFVSILLFDKYGSLLQWLRGQTNVDTLLIAFPDEYFFIVLSMTVTGAVAVWRWDAIFPDHRDYINLVPLPISTRTIFLANLVAVLFLIGLVALDVNAASCVLFPMVVTASQSSFLFFFKFGAVHAVGVILGSVFSFFAVFSVLGILMAVLPPRAFQRASAYVRGVVVVYLVALLSTSFAVPELLRRIKGPAPAWTYLAPSCWFVGLCQSLRGRATPAMRDLARLPLPGIVALVALAFCMYALGYRRHFVRIAEIADTATVAHNPRKRFWRALERFALQTPFEKGSFRFVGKTLMRSEAHRLVLTAISGLGLVLASQALMSAFESAKSLRKAALTPDALSIPFILTFLIVIGLRAVFEIPVELRANWVFQLMLDPDGHECETLARKVVFVGVLPWVLVITFAVYVSLAGLLVAVLHTLLVASWTILLTNIVLIRYRKLPFTCSLPVFKQHSIVILISGSFAYLLYALSTPEFESVALLEPVRMLGLLPVAAVAWYIPHHLAKTTIDLERRLIFEDTAVRTVEGLRLSD
ncbi:MAG TPA: hypothetical protein VFO46_04090 [Candidatus Sulfotelmatobacter sp.]|nr:hypothetical protein [Candidatus Sulfotelmatobacter sp.]